MTHERIRQYNLDIASPFCDLVNTEILPGTGVDPEAFWSGLRDIIDLYRPEIANYLKSVTIIRSS